jgi:hypothetical protein
VETSEEGPEWCHKYSRQGNSKHKAWVETVLMAEMQEDGEWAEGEGSSLSTQAGQITKGQSRDLNVILRVVEGYWGL